MIAPVLPESERQRLLGLLGFSRWVRRGSAELPHLPAPPLKTARLHPGYASAADPRGPAQHPIAQAPVARHGPAPAAHSEPAAPRPATPAIRVTELCLLVLSERRHADAPLVRALAQLLPGAMICTADSATAVKARFAVCIGAEWATPPGVLAIATPTLAELGASAVAKRRLWWALKPLLRELGR